MTATVTSSPHPFRPDVVGEPNYRPHCLTCGGERHGLIPAPRRPADVTGEQE